MATTTPTRRIDEAANEPSAGSVNFRGSRLGSVGAAGLLLTGTHRAPGADVFRPPRAQRSQTLCFARNLHLRKFSISEVVSDLLQRFDRGDEVVYAVVMFEMG